MGVTGIALGIGIGPFDNGGGGGGFAPQGASLTLTGGDATLLAPLIVDGASLSLSGGAVNFARDLGAAGSSLTLSGGAATLTPPSGFLLDQVGSAAAAYSVRKLRAAYSGSAIRVRRSSDDAEQDIGFDGSGDLDTSALTTFVGAGDGFVVTMYDQSGNGRDATQATAGSQRQIVTSGTVETNPNGTPRLVTDAAFYTATLTLTQAFSAVVVCEHAGGATGAAWDYNGAGGTNRSMFRYITSAWNQFSGTSVSSGVSTQTLAVFTDLRSGASSRLRRNGTQIAASTPGTNGLANLTLFSQQGGSGIARISEVVFWDSDVSADFATIESEVATYYGITL